MIRQRLADMADSIVGLDDELKLILEMLLIERILIDFVRGLLPNFANLSEGSEDFLNGFRIGGMEVSAHPCFEERNGPARGDHNLSVRSLLFIFEWN